MHFQITKKMIDWLKPVLIEKNTDDDIYAWHVNFQYAAKKRFMVIMHDLTRFCVVLYGMNKKDMMDGDYFIFNAIYHVMLRQGYDDDLVKKYLNSVPTHITYGKTKNKVSVGRLNIIMDYALSIASEEGLDFNQPEQIHISTKLNTFIYAEDKTYKHAFYPHEKMLEYLKLI